MMRGGEIFVPRLPSVRITDLVDAMAPGIEKEAIGIRPGEKLHEVLISEDDARSTIDLGDRYVVEPAIHLYRYESFRERGFNPVAEGFRYASDTNDMFADTAAIRKLLEREELMPETKTRLSAG